MIQYLNLNGVRTFLSKIRNEFLSKSDAQNIYLKKADLNFTTTSDGVEIRDSNNTLIYKIPVMKE